MKKKLFIFALVATLMINIFTKANAEQYVLACKIKISAVHMLTNKVLRTYMIDRYFIIDTVLAGVYDANNLPLDVNEFNDSEIVFTKKEQVLLMLLIQESHTTEEHTILNLMKSMLTHHNSINEHNL